MTVYFMSHDSQVTTFWMKVLTVAEEAGLENIASNAADFHSRVVRKTLIGTA